MTARGFSVIELLVTLSLLALLATVSLPLVQIQAQREKEKELRRALVEIREAIDAYKLAADAGRVEKKTGASGYPKSLDLLAEGVPDLRSPDGRKLYFLRRVPRDPFAIHPDLPAAQTWFKRAYASPPHSPEEGEDVYDIASRSNKIGLNGIALKEW
ncbi:type II secretion system protein [Massilia sp. W12]|uniref:type II secretion system protein n=1 Tax=Massilia sp. W12 TaxID=3126507 RepID=UPI0030CFE6BF